MSDSIIRDGTGTGYKAQVDSDNRIATQAITTSRSTFIANAHGKSFIFSVNELTVTGGQESFIMWFQNNSTIENMFLQQVIFSWNGGDTNHNRTVLLRTWVGPTEPSANNATGVFGNTNSSSSIIADATGYYWNGTGTGMTVSDFGTKTLGMYHAQGQHLIDVNGGFIFGKGRSAGSSVIAEETGKLSIAIQVWFE